jgi:3-phenylpropionate/trans-cinnamate dioxygenase ferredoxin reductase subunit
LRPGGHVGRITLIGDESHAPYERPSLSNEFLGSAAAERLAWVRPSAWYTEAEALMAGYDAEHSEHEHGH